MSNEEILGVMIGLGVLVAVTGYLADIYFHPQRFRWLELPRSSRQEPLSFAKTLPSRRPPEQG